MNYDRLQKYLGTKDMSAVEAMQKIDINSKGILNKEEVDRAGYMFWRL